MRRPSRSKKSRTSACSPGARTSWTARTITATERLSGLLFVVLLGAGFAAAQDVRQHTRPAGPKETTITESQAAALTLTLSTASVRPIQTWIRTAGTIDTTGKILRAFLLGREASLVKAGQRVRAFPPSSKSSMYQAS